MIASGIDFGILADVTLAMRLAVGAVFAASALAKLRDAGTFLQTVRDYRLLPDRAASVVAPLVIAAEIAIAASLLSGVIVTGALIAAAFSLVTFLVAVIINLRRNRIVNCGCFGSQLETISFVTVARLTLLILAAIALAYASLGGVREVNLPAIYRSGWSALPFLLDILALSSFLVIMTIWVLNAHFLVRVMDRGRRARSVPEPAEGSLT